MKKYLEIAKIVSVHGVHGDMNAQAWCDSPKQLGKLKKLYSADGSREYILISARPKGESMAILKIKGVDTPEAAQALRNTVLYADRADIPLPEGSNFIADLIGMSCVTVEGEPLGTVTDVLATGANDVYEITREGKKYYIPAIPSVVVSADAEAGIMTVSPMEGLFD